MRTIASSLVLFVLIACSPSVVGLQSNLNNVELMSISYLRAMDNTEADPVPGLGDILEEYRYVKDKACNPGWRNRNICEQVKIVMKRFEKIVDSYDGSWAPELRDEWIVILQTEFEIIRATIQKRDFNLGETTLG